MKTGGRYEVTGTLPFRGHTKGTIFEATLDPRAEARAIQRKNIRLLERIKPTLRPGSYRLPKGWTTPSKGGVPQ